MIDRAALVRDLFAVVTAAEAKPSTPAADPRPPRPLRRQRDFVSARELVWDVEGRRFACRDVETFNGVPAYHVYTAWELADAVFYDITVEGLTPAALRAFGRIDTRRPHAPLVGDRAPFDWEREQQVGARDLIRELCPETARLKGEQMCGVYDLPHGVRLTVDPAFRFAAALAAWRPTA